MLFGVRGRIISVALGHPTIYLTTIGGKESEQLACDIDVPGIICLSLIRDT